MHGLPWDVHTYGTPWDTGIWCPCGMHAHTVPCGTQAGVVGTPRGPPSHQVKCHPRAATCPGHKPLLVTHQAARTTPRSARAPRQHPKWHLPSCGRSSAGASAAFQSPVYQMGPNYQQEMLIMHVLCGCPLLLVVWLCSCRQALRRGAIAFHRHHGVWKASVSQRNTPRGF